MNDELLGATFLFEDCHTLIELMRQRSVKRDFGINWDIVLFQVHVIR